MKFLTDEGIDRQIVERLRKDRHDVRLFKLPFLLSTHKNQVQVPVFVCSPELRGALKG